jgi:hypothetical protein
MYNNDGVVVRANSTTIQSAVTNYVHTDPTYTGIILSTQLCLFKHAHHHAHLSDQNCGNVSSLSLSLRTGGGAESWPLAAVGSLIYRSRTMADCNKAKALADYMFYSQIDSGARLIAQRCTTCWKLSKLPLFTHSLFLSSSVAHVVLLVRHTGEDSPWHR